MPQDLPLGCTCGLLTGVVRAVTPHNGNRLSCLCDDCQRYAHLLGRPDLLDQYGGTDLSYATPSRVSLTAGREQLACLRLSEKGLLRWYARCCRTPIANTAPSPRVAFVGIPHLALHSDSGQRDADLGPLVHRLQARFAPSEPPAGSHPAQPLALVLRGYGRILWDSLTRQHTPNLFFDETNGLPVVPPEVHTPSPVEPT